VGRGPAPPRRVSDSGRSVRVERIVGDSLIEIVASLVVVLQGGERG
jgi:hypothetical protein